jgi:energy-coupling factor transporter ATP-binding protein EcfA2
VTSFRADLWTGLTKDQQAPRETVEFSLEISRAETVAALWNRLQKVNAVLVRGTPASGKSTLARLLAAHVRVKEPDLPIFVLDWPRTLPNGCSIDMPWRQLLERLLGLPETEPYFWTSRLLLIVDEAQGSYRCEMMWNAIVKSRPRPAVVMFSSYGSPIGDPLENPAPTAMRLNPRQLISIHHSNTNEKIALFFTKPEFDDLVNKVCKYHSRNGQRFIVSQELADYVYEFSSGQSSGALALLMGLWNATVSAT